MFNYFSNENLRMRNGMSATISIKNWFALLLISFFSLIPFLGFIIAFISYICLAFKKETSPSIANFLKAYFILALISFLIGILIIVLIFSLAQGLTEGLMI